jgi:hypothetical protein
VSAGERNVTFRQQGDSKMLLDEERRDFMRLIAQTDVTITQLSSGETLTARLNNLSASGCAFTADAAMEIGEELGILVRSPSERIEPLQRSAHVVRSTQSDGRHLIGVEFVGE